MSIQSYKGNEKYIFISYAHKDRDIVISELNLLQEYRCRFWYDEGIEAGEDWAGRIGKSLDSASAVLLFASDYALKRENVLREIQYAIQKKLPILVVKMGNKPFPEEMQKELLTNQIVNINSVSTYGELTEKLLPALKNYGVIEDPDPSGLEKSAIASKRIRSNGKLKTNNKAITFAGIALGCILAVFLVRFLLFSSVPNVVGMQADDAQNIVTDAGMDSQISLDYSSDYEYGVIFKQSAGGTVFKYIPIILSQSLGPNENLTTVPDVVGNHISDGAIALAACEMTKFTIHPESESQQQVEYISAQSIPAGLRVSKDSKVQLDVKTNGEDISFYYNGELITVSGTEDSELDLSMIKEQMGGIESEVTDEISGLDLNRPESFGMTEEEWQLFYANNHHSTDEDNRWENLWFPTINEEMMTENPDSCYGWVAVRDMELSADNLFTGYKELYVCPGVTVTVKGNNITSDASHDFYIADGGTLVFDNGLEDYARICNDGHTVMNGNFNTAAVPSIVYNRGSFETSGRYAGDITFFSFGEGTHTGDDETLQGIIDFGLFGSEFYEGVSGSKGMVKLSDGFRTYDALLKDAKIHSYASEDPRYTMRLDSKKPYIAGSYYYPVFIPDQLSAHAAEPDFCFGMIVLNDMECREDWRTDPKQMGYIELIVAPGATLVYPEELSGQRYGISIYQGARFVVNGILNGKPEEANCDIEIFNEGTLEVNGVIDGSYDYWGCSSLLNMGNITGNGVITGSNMNTFMFKGSTSTIDLGTCKSVNYVDYRPTFKVINNGPRSRWDFVWDCFDKHKDDEDKTAYIQEALRRGLLRD